MEQPTVTYQQVQTVDSQQVVVSDSLATSKTLRTPIQHVTVAEPKHLKVQRVFRPKKKIEYRTWSAEDSVYFNLQPSDSADEISSITTPVAKMPPSAVASEKSTDAPEQVVDSAVLVKDTIVVEPAPPILQRKGSPFADSKDWLSGFVLLALIIAGLIKLSAGRYLSDLFSSIRYQQSASKLFSSGNLQNQKPAWALTVLFFLTTSMLIFEFAHIAGKSPQRFSPFIFFLLVNAGVVGYFFIKNLLYRFVAAVFEAQQATKEYLFNANMLSKVFGIACLPIVSVVPFVDVLTATFILKAGLALFIIMYIIQLLRGAKIILTSTLSIFYMFLYFCALEILPLSILIKVLIY